MIEQRKYRDFFGSLANASRLDIVQYLRRRDATVTQIATDLGYEQSRVSHSLARLSRAGIVAVRREDSRKLFHLVEDVTPLLQEIETFLLRGERGSVPQRDWAPEALVAEAAK